jgi:hypothetical protein
MQSKSRCYNPFKKAAEAKRYWSKSGLNLGRKKCYDSYSVSASASPHRQKHKSTTGLPDFS